MMCTVPPPSPVLSASKDEGAHGRKLYYLYVKDDAAYESLGAGGSSQKVGQALVKESYYPIEVGKGEEAGWVAESKGRYYRLGQLYALFVMLKLDPKTPGTDNGWVYATLSPDGKEITAQGRIESCMSCHEDAAHDRLFGPRQSAPNKDR